MSGRHDALILAAGAAVLALFVAAELRIAGAIGLPLDDGWIHLRFAENLAAGRGFAINPGEPVAGSTAPLWTVLLAAALALGLPGLVAAKALGVLAYGAAGLLARRFALAVGLPPGLALACGIGVLGLGRLAWGALSGMEVPLAAALVAAAALLVVRDRPHGAAAMLGAATLARPEAGLLVLLHAAGAGRLLGALGRAAVSGAVLAPELAFNLRTVGRLLPGTAIAKVEGGLVGTLVGVADSWPTLGRRVAAYAADWLGLLFADHVGLPLLLVLGMAALWRSRVRWLALALVVHPVAMALVAPYRGPGFQTGRYSTHLAPLAVVVAAAGLAALGRALPARVALRAGALAVAGLALLFPLGPASRAYGWGVQNINAMQVRLGRWVARETPPDAVLAVNDVGAVSYFGHRRIIDLMGLVTPDIVPARRAGERGLLRYLESACPDYLVVFPAWFPALAARAELFHPVERVRLAHNLVAGADEMVVYETVWRRTPRSAGACPGAGRS